MESQDKTSVRPDEAPGRTSLHGGMMELNMYIYPPVKLEQQKRKQPAH